MITLDIQSELPQAIAWTNAHTKQLPYSVAQALNAAVQGSRFIAGSKQKSAINKLAGSARRYLDRPKKQTAEGFRATAANKRNLSSLITTKDRPWSRDRFLSGNIRGGVRKPKAWEAALRGAVPGALPPGAQLVPTGALRPDKYGNISKANINRLFTGLNDGQIFVGKPRGAAGRSVASGIYRRGSKQKPVLRPLFALIQPARYSPRFPAESEISKSVQKNFGLYLRHQLQRNVSAEIRRGTADLRTGLF